MIGPAAVLPLRPWRRSLEGQLQISGGIMLLALMLASTQGFLLSQTNAARALPGLLISLTSLVLGLAAVRLARRATGRLARATESLRDMVERCGGTGALLSGQGDELTEISQALNVLREHFRRAKISEANLTAAVENMVEGIVMVSADGKVSLHNQRLLKIFGLPSMNATGMPRAEFNALLVRALHWPQSAQDYLQRQLEAVRADGHYRVFDLELPNNKVLRYSASMLADGNVMSYVEDISEQRAAAASILRLENYDVLTDLPNRALFQEHVAAAVATTAREPQLSAQLLLCDLDRFKVVNETYGHPVGDELLRQVARRLRACMRPDDVLARLGSDEFAVISIVQGAATGTERIAERLIASLDQPFEINGHEISIGLSIGLAIAPQDADSDDALMKRAAMALHASKRGGRNRYRMYEPPMSLVSDEYGSIELALRKAIDTGSMQLHYQPQIDLHSDRIVGFEALARWNRPDKGAVPPSVFIPLAEETGLVVPLGAWALRQACADARRWGRDITVAVNVAPQQLQVAGFADVVREALQLADLPADQLELEITESAPLQDDAAVLAVLAELARMGVRISIDDFGTGHTGLTYLHKFRFDKLKIDQSFIRKLEDGKDAEIIVRAILDLSATLGVKTVAEGIETEHQAAILRGMQCDVGQGYLFGRPAPVEVANALVEQQRSLAASVRLPVRSAG